MMDGKEQAKIAQLQYAILRAAQKGMSDLRKIQEAADPAQFKKAMNSVYPASFEGIDSHKTAISGHPGQQVPFLEALTYAVNISGKIPLIEKTAYGSELLAWHKSTLTPPAPPMYDPSCDELSTAMRLFAVQAEAETSQRTPNLWMKDTSGAASGNSSVTVTSPTDARIPTGSL